MRWDEPPEGTAEPESFIDSIMALVDRLLARKPERDAVFA
jgi:hypothetical protein